MQAIENRQYDGAIEQVILSSIAPMENPALQNRISKSS
jgi:hypothetical protein